MSIQQKHGISGISLKGDNASVVYKLDLGLCPIFFDTRGNNPSNVAASIVNGPAGLTVAPTITADRVTLTFNQAFTGDISINLVLYFDSK